MKRNTALPSYDEDIEQVWEDAMNIFGIDIPIMHLPTRTSAGVDNPLSEFIKTRSNWYKCRSYFNGLMANDEDINGYWLKTLHSRGYMFTEAS